MAQPGGVRVEGERGKGMKEKITMPTESEIATRKRLRLICEWFSALNQSVSSRGESWETVEKRAFAEVEAQHFDRADLVAIRGCPGKWTRGNPYEWLWILHRYQNSKQSKTPANKGANEYKKKVCS